MGLPQKKPVSSPNQDKQLASAIASSLKELTQSLRQLLGNPPLADNGAFLGHLSGVITGLNDPAQQASALSLGEEDDA